MRASAARFMTPISTIRSSRPVLNAATADFQLALNIRSKRHSPAEAEKDKAEKLDGHSHYKVPSASDY
jgi:hypothetical protein